MATDVNGANGGGEANPHRGVFGLDRRGVEMGFNAIDSLRDGTIEGREAAKLLRDAIEFMPTKPKAGEGGMRMMHIPRSTLEHTAGQLERDGDISGSDILAIMARTLDEHWQPGKESTVLEGMGKSLVQGMHNGKLERRELLDAIDVGLDGIVDERIQDTVLSIAHIAEDDKISTGDIAAIGDRFLSTYLESAKDRGRTGDWMLVGSELLKRVTDDKLTFSDGVKVVTRALDVLVPKEQQGELDFFLARNLLKSSEDGQIDRHDISRIAISASRTFLPDEYIDDPLITGSIRLLTSFIDDGKLDDNDLMKVGVGIGQLAVKEAVEDHFGKTAGLAAGAAVTGLTSVYQNADRFDAGATAAETTTDVLLDTGTTIGGAIAGAQLVKDGGPVAMLAGAAIGALANVALEMSGAKDFLAEKVVSHFEEPLAVGWEKIARGQDYVQDIFFTTSEAVNDASTWAANKINKAAEVVQKPIGKVMAFATDTVDNTAGWLDDHLVNPVKGVIDTAGEWIDTRVMQPVRDWRHGKGDEVAAGEGGEIPAPDGVGGEFADADGELREEE